MNMKIYVLAVLAASAAFADQGALTNSGGSTSGGYIINSTVANPPGALSITATTLNFLSTDGGLAINATFSSVSSLESCSGGGKGGHVSCGYTFKGTFSGTLTVNGAPQAINGTTSQGFGVGGTASGVTGYNSAYTPFYFTDGNARILRCDDLSGTNAIAFGTQGTGTGQFYGPSGIALDSAGRIYIADTYNDRIVRIDDMNGTNWTSFGTYGTGTGQFMGPQSISIDPAGHIWVLDYGVGLIRMDDMNGTNWTAVWTPAANSGSGVGQFAALSSAPGFDALGRIYIADAGNRWIVRFDDVNFTNWTTLSQSQPVGPYIYLFGSVTGVVTDAAGKIYVADGTNITRVDDMTGANWTSISVGTFPPHTIAVDASGMVVLGNGYDAQIVDSEATVLTSNLSNLLVQGVYLSVYGAVPIPLPSPRPSAISFNPSTVSFTQNLGTTGTQAVTITNFGGSPLTFGTIAASGGFGETNNCPSQLSAGSNCAVTVTFTPSAAGAVSGALTINDDSGNAGAVQTVTLSGTGTAPIASVSPASISFGSVVQGASSTAKTITLLNSGTGPLQVTSVTAPAPFAQTNTCTSVAPGSSCAISVTFAPATVGSFTGALSIVDNAGTQTVALSGSSTAQVTLSVSSLSLGSMVVGSTSAAKTVTLTNHAKVAVTFSSVAAGGAFALASNTCGASIAAGTTCTVGVTFTPVATGAATGALTFTDSALNTPQTVALTGTGTAAGATVTVSPASLTFPQQPTGTTSAGMSVTVANTGTTAVTNNGVTIAGDFAETTTCASSIAAGKSCTVTVTFSPTVFGTRTGALTISLSSGVQTVSLSGTSAVSGQPGALSLFASTLTFSGYTIGDNPSKSVTVSNTGGSSVGIGSVTIAGDPSFTEKTTCGSALAAAASCTITVTFKPVAYGTFAGTVTLTEASGAQHAIAVTGVSSADN